MLQMTILIPTSLFPRVEINYKYLFISEKISIVEKSEFKSQPTSSIPEDILTKAGNNTLWD